MHALCSAHQQGLTAEIPYLMNTRPGFDLCGTSLMPISKSSLFTLIAFAFQPLFWYTPESQFKILRERTFPLTEP